MSLRIGDAVLVHINDESRSQRIGVLEYIGYIDSNKRSKFVGINLVESVENGHNGTINGIQHFKAIAGHGIYVRMQNVVKKLDCRELTSRMQQIMLLFKQRITQYIKAVSERDDYIEELKISQRKLKKLLNKSKKQTTQNNKSLHTITELMTHCSPPPLSKMTSEESHSPIPKDIKKHTNKNIKYSKRKKHEYTKYSDRHKNINDIKTSDLTEYYTSENDIDSNDSTSEESDETTNTINDEDDTSDDNSTWRDDRSYTNNNKKYGPPTPISISTHSRDQSRQSRSNKKINNNNNNNPIKPKTKIPKWNYKQKSHSTHNTPHQSPTVHKNNSRHMELMSQSISPQNHNFITIDNNGKKHMQSFSNHSNYSNSPYNNENIYHPNTQRMQQLYDMMLSQQQQQQQQQPIQRSTRIHPMVPITRNQTAPNVPQSAPNVSTIPMTNTKRRSLHKIQPIPELRDKTQPQKQKQELKLRNRRSNSVDAFYFSDVQLKNQVVNIKNIQQYKNNNNNNNQNYNNGRQYVFQQPTQQYNYSNNSPPSDQKIYTVTQPLQDHFSAYF